MLEPMRAHTDNSAHFGRPQELPQFIADKFAEISLEDISMVIEGKKA